MHLANLEASLDFLKAGFRILWEFDYELVPNLLLPPKELVNERALNLRHKFAELIWSEELLELLLKGGHFSRANVLAMPA